MKQDKMVEFQKNRKAVMEAETLAVIRRMISKGKPVNFPSVAKATGHTTKYLYDNEKIRAEIMSHRKPVTPKSEESAKAETAILKIKNVKLQKENKKLKEENNETWKRKYEMEHQKNLVLYHEIQELKKQLKSLYSQPIAQAAE